MLLPRVTTDKQCVLHSFWSCTLANRSFYQYVTTLRSGLCYRKSVCRLSSFSSATFVRPTQRIETFGNISSPFCTLAILWPLCKFYGDQGNPSVGNVKRKMGSKIQRCHVRVSHLLMSSLLYWVWVLTAVLRIFLLMIGLLLVQLIEWKGSSIHL